MSIQGLLDCIAILISLGSLWFARGSYVRSSKALDLQDKVNEMESQIKEHDLEMIRQETALKVSSWMTNEVPLKDDETIPIMIANYTNLPIYDVVVAIDIVSDNGAYHMDQRRFAAYTHFVPPGCYYMYAPWHGGGMNKKFNSAITYRDAKGKWWCRDAAGNVEESENSLDKYGIMRPPTSEHIYKYTM